MGQDLETETVEAENKNRIVRFGIASGIVAVSPDMGRVYDAKTVVLTEPGLHLERAVSKLFTHTNNGFRDIQQHEFSESFTAHRIESTVKRTVSAFTTAYDEADTNFNQPVREVIGARRIVSESELMGIGMAIAAKSIRKGKPDKEILASDDMRYVIERYNELYSDVPGVDLGRAMTEAMGDIRGFETARKESERPRVLVTEIKEPRLAGSLPEAIKNYLASAFKQQFIGQLGPESVNSDRDTPRIVVTGDLERWQVEFDKKFPKTGEIPQEWKIKPVIVLRHGVGRDSSEFSEAKEYMESMGLTVEALDFPDFGSPGGDGKPHDSPQCQTTIWKNYAQNTGLMPHTLCGEDQWEGW